MWDKIANQILRNRTALIIFLALTTALMLYKASQVQLAYDNPKFVPNDDPDYKAYVEFKKLFGDDGSVMVVGINDPQINKLDFFNDWLALTNEIENTENINQVLSVSNMIDLVKVKKRTVFEGDSFEKDEFEAHAVVNTPPKTQAELDTIIERMHNLRFYEGLLYTDSTDFSLMAITLDKKILDTKRRLGFVDELQSKIDKVCDKYNVEVHYSGLPFIRTKMSQMIQKELVFFTLISMLITSLILWFFFRSIPTLIFSLLVVVVGVIWCMGILVLLGFKITMFVGLLPPLIVVIGIANCIYLLNKYHDEFVTHRNKMKALQREISKVGQAVLFTNLTTAIGFGVFVLTGSLVLQEFGLTSFLSIIAVFIISIILIPVLFSFLPPPSIKHTKHLDYKRLNKFVENISAIAIKKRKLVFGTSIVIAILSVIGISLLQNVGYMVDDISKEDKLYKDLKFFENEIKGVMPFEIVIDTKKKQGVFDPSILTKIDLLERELVKIPEFSKPISVSQTLKFLNQAFYDGDRRRYISPAALDLSAIRDAIPDNQTNANMLNSLVDSTYQKARISVQMADVGSNQIKHTKDRVAGLADTIFNMNRNTEHFFSDSIVDISLIDSANNIFDTTYFAYSTSSYTPITDEKLKTNVNITGTSIIFLKGNDYLVSNLLLSLLVAFIIISMLMAGIFKSMRMILISLVPNMLPLLFTAGIMGYLGVTFKPSTVLVFSVAFGIAVDFSIHFLTKYKMELRKTADITTAVKTVQKEISTSMIYTAVILFFGFIIFIGSSFGGTMALGLFTAITLLVALVSNLILLPSLLMAYDKSKNK